MWNILILQNQMSNNISGIIVDLWYMRVLHCRFIYHMNRYRYRCRYIVCKTLTKNYLVHKIHT